MDARRFDAFARSLARRLPRRGLVCSAAVTLATGAARVVSAQPADDDAASGSVGLRCTPCDCQGDRCDCCLVGITGGGVVRTATGDVNLVLFATQLAEDAPQQAAGFVRWIDPNPEGGLSLESVGPIAYDWPEGEEKLRYVRGIMAVNGAAQQPFVLEVFDAGPGKPTEDAARLTVGDTSGSTDAGFSYEAAGSLVGGDLQLLGSVAPVAPAS